MLTQKLIRVIICLQGQHKEVNKMAQKKKGGNKDQTLQKLVFATAILNLVKALIEIIRELSG